MKKVLIISYHFPPIAGAGVYRTLKFAKYISYYDWMPLVLCAKKSKLHPTDDTLINQIPQGVKVFRTRAFESKIYAYAPVEIGFNPRWYQIPDNFIGWIPFALSLSKKIIQEENIDLIYTTSPPYTAALIGMLLKKKTDKPWVADFRDPWTQQRIYPTKFHKKLEEYMEKKVAEYADKIICNTEINRSEFIRKYNVSTKKCTTIMNGFDPEDFKNLEKRGNDRFTLTYSGGTLGVYEVERFLSALKKLLTERSQIRKNIKLIITGKKDKGFSRLVESLGMEEIVDQKGYLPYADSVHILVNSDVLVVVLPPHSKKHCLVKGWVPSKIFNYFGAKRPILALAPKNSATAEIIKSTDTGIVVRPDDEEGIKEAIYWFYKKWKEGKLKIEPNWDIIKKYSRKNQTKKLAQLFDDVINLNNNYDENR